MSNFLANIIFHEEFHNAYRFLPIEFGCPLVNAAAFKGEGVANDRHGLLMRATVPPLFKVKPAGARPNHRNRVKRRAAFLT